MIITSDSVQLAHTKLENLNTLGHSFASTPVNILEFNSFLGNFVDLDARVMHNAPRCENRFPKN